MYFCSNTWFPKNIQQRFVITWQAVSSAISRQRRQPASQPSPQRESRLLSSTWPPRFINQAAATASPSAASASKRHQGEKRWLLEDAETTTRWQRQQPAARREQEEPRRPRRGEAEHVPGRDAEPSSTGPTGLQRHQQLRRTDRVRQAEPEPRVFVRQRACSPGSDTCAWRVERWTSRFRVQSAAEDGVLRPALLPQPGDSSRAHRARWRLLQADDRNTVARSKGREREEHQTYQVSFLLLEITDNGVAIKSIGARCGKLFILVLKGVNNSVNLDSIIKYQQKFE